MGRQRSILEVKQQAGRFCAFRERSPQELFEKVQSWGLSDEQSATIVADLAKQGYVDEQRFANAYCNDKFEFNSWGKQKIKASLFPHKLAQQVIQNALDRIDPAKYEQRLLQLAQTKWESLAKEEEVKRKQKTVAYLANKGFEMDLIWAAIEKLSSKESH